ncbi:DNA cytosine methyltransferase [Clostridium paraputrificum]|uniref:DNA cytosine methyltransferase n=1 Tax=Clostridium paraputrificum TaxID=29363 RepID=UPI00232CFBF4|nr:DNA (cytosine-5-)-methyltransferase [Clostridium paraputrificum]MDB2122153.1 DNA (cytosine-5-)-methyltransferase [Clostridium paraputrificum]
MKIKMLSLFSGIGSPEVALKRLNVDLDLVGFSEIDKYAIKSYCAIHNVDEGLNLGDIRFIDAEKLPKGIDLITHGSPCQDFSVAGNNAGGDKESGTRSSLMWYTVDIVRICKPKYVIWENVKNVLSKKHKHNFERYIEELKDIGYKNHYKILNSKNYGIPQNRERVFVISIRGDIDKDFMFPKEFEENAKLIDFLDEEVESKYYLNDEKIKVLVSNIDGTIDIDKKIIGTCNKNNKLDRCTRELIFNSKYEIPTLCASDYKDPKKLLIPTGGVTFGA